MNHNGHHGRRNLARFIEELLGPNQGIRNAYYRDRLKLLVKDSKACQSGEITPEYFCQMYGIVPKESQP